MKKHLKRPQSKSPTIYSSTDKHESIFRLEKNQEDLLFVIEYKKVASTQIDPNNLDKYIHSKLSEKSEKNENKMENDDVNNGNTSFFLEQFTTAQRILIIIQIFIHIYIANMNNISIMIILYDCFCMFITYLLYILPGKIRKKSLISVFISYITLSFIVLTHYAITIAFTFEYINALFFIDIIIFFITCIYMSQ